VIRPAPDQDEDVAPAGTTRTKEDHRPAPDQDEGTNCSKIYY
jgi:hypothetical protein